MSTLDTQSHCTGAADNASQLTKAGIRLLYGTDLAHPDVPWGIDAQELQLMLHAGRGVLTPLEVLSAGAGAARAAGRGCSRRSHRRPRQPFEQFKLLEYPDLVVSGGATIVEPVDDSRMAVWTGQAR